MSEPFLEMRNIVKTYPGVRAVDNVTLSVGRGEIRALVGENGAGKSTLIKILAGAEQADAGEIWLGGQRVRYDSPVEALRLGIGAIYQEFNLVPQLNVAQNIMLGQVPKKWGGQVDTEAMHRRAREMLARLNVSLDTRRLVADLDVAQQQVVEIAKGLARDLRVFIMDEPTAALSAVETEHLLDVVRALKQQGVAIIYITHRMREIFQIADSVTILKDGRHVETSPARSLTSDAIVAKMIGRDLTDYYPPRGTPASEVLFSVRDLNVAGKLFDINLDVRRGEILGIAGLEGQGQRELARIMFGALPYDRGTFLRNGQPIRLSSPSDAIRAGIAYVSDDRKRDGLVLIRSANENIALPSLSRRTNGKILIDEKTERSFVHHLIDRLAIKVTHRSQKVNNLSGGNQQKIVVGKWLGMEPQILIVSEPTRGIDVGSKSEIHHILRDLANQGVGIVMVSSELPEILGMSDRILVMAEGRIVAEMDGATATEEQLMAAAAIHSVSDTSVPVTS
ncbi:MAG: sugar ABC transporter ATP-binding protein [Chloroflexota bacterium]|nr:MAG: D-xylose ABC transporter ATP-binding protein [Chloroflexota bacterium]